MFARQSALPRISVETTTLQIYRDLLSTTDQLTLMSALEAQLNEPSKLAVLPFRSAQLRRCDGVATRAGWRPTEVHRHFLDVLRKHAPQVREHDRARSRR
jgi:hypothetical protein